MNAHRSPQRGFTLVELLVGLALALVVVAAGTLLLARQAHEQRALVIEARLMQDLRSTADLVARDLRRAGHWGDAGAGVWTAATAPRAKAKSVIFLFMEGGPSQMDTFDPKPRLAVDNGRPCPIARR